MTVDILYEGHARSTDNEAGIASGHSDPSLSELGRQQARNLGNKHKSDNLACIYSSDLKRAMETVALAFPKQSFRTDKRLRECDYGELTRSPREEIVWTDHIDEPFPGGESLRHVVDRVQEFLDDEASQWQDATILVVGHRAPKLALDHLLGGMTLEDAAAAPLDPEPGWRYEL